MTLAIGMLCEDGLILATDTRASYADGTIQDADKLKTFEAGEGVYGIAQSSEDINAADSLIAELKAELLDKPPNALVEFIKIAKDVMHSWSLAPHEPRPTVQMLVVLFIKGQFGFYFCEPPNTVKFIHEQYKAIGEGFKFTDPIYHAWFKGGPLVCDHTALSQISYMMHKAKQLFPATIGGETDAVLLTRGFSHPCLIRRSDMAEAEARGTILDRLMGRFASLVMASSLEGTPAILRLAEGIYQGGLSYANLEFHSQFPDKTIRRKFPILDPEAGIGER
jgi:hypothetical protein